MVTNLSSSTPRFIRGVNKRCWDERNDAPPAKEATISNLSLEDDDFESPLTFKQRMSTTVYGPLNLGGLVAIGLALLMVTATVFIIQPAWLGFERDYEYELIDFDQTQARNFAEDLVNLGHPDWEGRMSATTEEANTSQYISQKFQEMGYAAEINEFQVPMHHVNSEPSFRLCVRGACFSSLRRCNYFRRLSSDTLPTPSRLRHPRILRPIRIHV